MITYMLACRLVNHHLCSLDDDLLSVGGKQEPEIEQTIAPQQRLSVIFDVPLMEFSFVKVFADQTRLIN